MNDTILPNDGRRVTIFKGHNNTHYTLEYLQILDGEWVIVGVGRFTDLNAVSVAIGEFIDNK